MSYNNKVELLAPVGSSEVLDAAIGEGADAVYLGLKDFNARLRAANFSYREFEAIVDRLHSMKKKIYVALNTIFEDWEKDRIYNLLKYLSLVKPDGVIVQDLGIIKLVNDNFPDLKIHASTQLNVSSAKGVNILSKYGVSRVVLGRELDLKQIKEIRNNSRSELEIFVHGALCVSISGLCLFSSYLGGKSANRGCCTQPCRRLYDNFTNKGYFFSTKDLMLIDHIPELIDLGINSFKIEGRMRSYQYVATVVKAYRYVIDNFKDDREGAVEIGREILSNDFARKKTDYFFVSKNNNDFLSCDESGGTGIYLGKIIDIYEGKAKVGLQDKSILLEDNDTVRIHSADDKVRKSVKIKELIRGKNSVSFKVPEEFSVNDDVYLVSSKDSIKKYTGILPGMLSPYKRHPGNLKAPKVKFEKNKKHDKSILSGFYVRINNFRDIYITQSVKPQKLIIDLTKNNINDLKGNIGSTSYRENDIIFYLDPYFSQSNDEWLADAVNSLIEKKYNKFIVNNIGHYSLFSGKDVTLINGPYIYNFNRYSLQLNMDFGSSYFISPLEINKKTLLSMSEQFNRSDIFVTIFTFPELFQLSKNYNKIFNFQRLADNTENLYDIVNSDDRSILVPEKPFSIIDKLPYLKKNGFNKFIIDFSYIKLQKNYYKNIMQSAERCEILTDVTRFNWKDGFYRNKMSRGTAL